MTEPYYSKILKIDGEDQEVKLFKYSAKCIAMVSPEKFGKGFSKNLKDAGGKFNKNLSVGAGWIFKIDSETQGKISSFLKDVFTEKIKWETGEVMTPLIENNEIDEKIFNTLGDLLEFIPIEKEDRMISDKDGAQTFVYYNKDESTVIQGDTIYSFESAHKSLLITQLRTD